MGLTGMALATVAVGMGLTGIALAMAAVGMGLTGMALATAAVGIGLTGIELAPKLAVAANAAPKATVHTLSEVENIYVLSSG